MTIESQIQTAFERHQAGDLKQAAALYLKLLEIEPQNARVLFLLGTLRCQEKNFTVALDFLNRAVMLNPNMSEAFTSIANAHLGLGDKTSAEKNYRQAMALNHQAVQPRLNLATLLVERGNAHKAEGQFGAAEIVYREACDLNPNDALALNNLGIVLKDQDKIDESLACFAAIKKLGKLSGEYLLNYAVALKEMGRFGEALDCYKIFFKEDLARPEAHYNHAQLLILMEDFERGWPEFEWRLKMENYSFAANYAQKKWQGEALAGKSILITAEQGLADEFCYAHVLGEIAATAKACFYEAHPKLVSLFQRSFPQIKVSARSLDGTKTMLAADSNIDYHALLGSLMPKLRPTRASFNKNKPYLKADADKIIFWQNRLASLGKNKKVGIAWKSNAPDAHNASRVKGSTDIKQWEKILKEPGTDFINLQYGDTESEKKFVKDHYGATLHDWPDLDQFNDLDSVAALVSNLDLVISINSAVAYLTAALGKPVQIFAPFAFAPKPGNDYVSPWSKFITYLVQRSPGDWGSIFP